MTYLSCFKPKNLLRWLKKGRRKSSLAPEINWDRLFNLISDPGFDDFLKFLALTVDDKAYILTTMNLFDEKQKQEAIKIQYTMAGLNLIPSLVEELKHQAEEKIKNEMEK